MSAMKKFFQSLSGEVAQKPAPKERIDIFKALLNELELNGKHEGHRRNDAILIPQLLNKIIQLLLEEEREAEVMQEGTGPCIEFFLQSRILERLCHLAAVNKPVGMFQWIINAIARIIQHMKSPLLAHSSMHKPLVRLLSTKPSKLSFEEKVEVLKLITSLAHKLKEAPIFVKLFWSSGNLHSRPLDQSTSPTLSTSPIMTSHLHAQQKVASLSTIDKKHFVLFKILDRIYRGSSSDRRLVEQVRRCILSCIVIDDNYNELQAYLARQTKFLEHTMREMGKLYATLVRESYSGNSNANSYLQEYFRQLQFCSALCKIDFSRNEEALRHDSPARRSPVPPGYSPSNASHNSECVDFSQQIASKLREHFFLPILIPGLLSDDARLSNIHTMFARETILQLDAPELMGAFISCLIGSSENASQISFGDVIEDPLTESMGHLVQETLISRIEYRPSTYPLDPNARKLALLSANTMRLFSTLMQFHPHNMYVAHHLLFKNLPIVANTEAHLRGYRHPTPSEETNPEMYKHALDVNWARLPEVVAASEALKSLPEDPPNLGLRFEQLLEMAPLARQTRDSGARPDVQTYHDYIKLRFKLARPHLLMWSSHPLTPERDFPPPFVAEKKPEYHGLHFSATQTPPEQVHLESQITTPPSRVLPPIAPDHAKGAKVTARRFIRVLLANLDHFLELPLDFALYLTDTIALIAQYPHRYIHKWTYHANQDPDILSLFSILQSLSSKALAFLDESPERLSTVLEFKESAEKKETQDDQFELSSIERASHNIILLDEFCKELLAVLLLVDQLLN
jgi:hypothetical protein